MRMTALIGAVIATSFLGLATTPASAQATRTWVSGVGDDVNPCSRTAPCKTWAGAISKTAAGGEIDALDPGGFGAVTITKGITLDGGGGIVASTLSAGVSGFIVNAGVNDVVTLKNIRVLGVSSSPSGIRFIAGSVLNVQNLTIEGFTTGIDFNPVGASRLQVMDTMITESSSVGIHIHPTSGGSAKVDLSRVNVTGSTVHGVLANSNTAGAGTVSVAITDSDISNNSGASANGITASGGAAAAVVLVNRSTISSNAAFGLQSVGATGVIILGGSTLANNQTGGGVANSGQLFSNGNNQMGGNAAGDGVFSPLALK